MKIKKIHLKNFKRFTDLTIDKIPETAKLVVLIGANGCGKSSLFDAFRYYQRRKISGLYHADEDYYYIKDFNDNNKTVVDIGFNASINNYNREKLGELFYLRTAYRNSPAISKNNFNQVTSPLNINNNQTKMIDNDSQVEMNYQRFIDEIQARVLDENNPTISAVQIKSDLLDEIKIPLKNILSDISFTTVSPKTKKADFLFNKGTIERYSYQNLSGGEKAVFDLLLDIVVKKDYYQDTIFCIDEPESHIHTNAQAKLLHELFKLIPDNSQLWIATHSFGMMKEAKRLMETHPNEIVFLNFDNNYNFDQETIITPSSNCDFILWNKMKEICFDDYADFILPKKIVLCEGSEAGNTRKDFDKQCYENIFPNVVFYSCGSCTDIENCTKEDKKINQLISLIKSLSSKTEIIKLMDRDDRSDKEIKDLNSQGIKVLSRRHLESYLFDDEVLKALCKKEQQEDKLGQIIQEKNNILTSNSSKPADDMKAAKGRLYVEIKKILGLTQCGNTADAFMRDTLSKLITPDMKVYQELEQDIFSPLEKTEQA